MSPCPTRFGCPATKPRSAAVLRGRSRHPRPLGGCSPRRSWAPASPSSTGPLSRSRCPRSPGWSGFSGITAAIGPLLGGWLVSHSWRWAFFLNVPFAALVLLLLRRVPESRNPEARGIDVPGALLVTLGLGGLVFGLIESPRRGW